MKLSKMSTIVKLKMAIGAAGEVPVGTIGVVMESGSAFPWVRFPTHPNPYTQSASEFLEEDFLYCYAVGVELLEEVVPEKPWSPPEVWCFTLKGSTCYSSTIYYSKEDAEKACREISHLTINELIIVKLTPSKA